jgi:hypothetical protein
MYYLVGGNLTGREAVVVAVVTRKKGGGCGQAPQGVLQGWEVPMPLWIPFTGTVYSSWAGTYLGTQVPT